MQEISVETAVQSQKPYVYLLCYPDGMPFYIGKGTGKRIISYEIAAQNLKNTSDELEVIRKIQRDGKKIVLKIDSICDSNEDAFAREKELVFKYGRKDIDKQGCLVNRAEGGYGKVSGKENGRKRKYKSVRVQVVLPPDLLVTFDKAIKLLGGDRSVHIATAMRRYIPFCYKIAKQEQQLSNENNAPN